MVRVQRILLTPQECPTQSTFHDKILGWEEPEGNTFGSYEHESADQTFPVYERAFFLDAKNKQDTHCIEVVSSFVQSTHFEALNLSSDFPHAFTVFSRTCGIHVFRKMAMCLGRAVLWCRLRLWSAPWSVKYVFIACSVLVLIGTMRPEKSCLRHSKKPPLTRD